MAVKMPTKLTVFGLMTKFDQVSVEDGQIEVGTFLQASTEVASVLDKLGTGFSIPKKDMLGNIKRINQRYKSHPEKFATINSMLEEDSHGPGKPESTVGAVLWLGRALDFLRAFLLGLSQSYKDHPKDGEDLRSVILVAYEPTLKPFHGKLVQFLFSNISRLVPYRSNFLKCLMKDPSATADQVISDIDLFLPNLTANVDRVGNLLNQYGLNSSEKV